MFSVLQKLKEAFEEACQEKERAVAESDFARAALLRCITTSIAESMRQVKALCKNRIVDVEI